MQVDNSKVDAKVSLQSLFACNCTQESDDIKIPLWTLNNERESHTEYSPVKKVNMFACIHK